MTCQKARVSQTDDVEKTHSSMPWEGRTASTENAKLIFGVMDLDRRNQKQRLKKEKAQKSNFFIFLFIFYFFTFYIFLLYKKKIETEKGVLKKCSNY
jgi:hypothetical protein